MRHDTRRPAYVPGGSRDPFGRTALNVAVTRISEADRIHRDMEPADAFDFEARAAFAAWPSGDNMQRILTCCRNLRRCAVAPHMTDEHLRMLWKTRGEG